MHQQQCRAVAGGVRPRIKPLAAGTSQGVAVSDGEVHPVTESGLDSSWSVSTWQIRVIVI